MRSNLPGPSQPWGNDIERRLQALEASMRSAEKSINGLSSSNQSISSTQGRTGIATYNTQTTIVSEISNYGGIVDLYHNPLWWPERGLYAQLTANVTFVCGESLPPDFINAYNRGAKLHAKIYSNDGSVKIHRESFISTTGLIGKGHYVIDTSYSFGIPYEDYSYGTLYIYAQRTTYPTMIDPSLFREARIDLSYIVL